MRTKGIAIPYIIALIIGIIVIIFVVYWVYRMFAGPQLTLEDCKASLIQWCTACKNNNWVAIGKTISDSVGTTCATILSDKLGVTGTNTCDLAGAKTDCAKVGVS